ncbi:bZIP transcription factor [Ceratocystis lukuohia]|uniref:BZIP domain-containing protein n=2 Tax=Ceratocystis TaxID=5157 RepID=A0A2C5X460_9PEZI|nr:hypothetical protein CFIMG_004832RA [Ceratocystis fimbriata CBS 114723]
MVSAMTPPYFDNGHVDTRYFTGEPDSLLNDTLMDSGLDSGIDMSPPLVSRKDSAMTNTSLFSHKPEDSWGVDMQSIPSTTSSGGITPAAPTFFPADVTSQALIGAGSTGNWIVAPNSTVMGVDTVVMPQQFDAMENGSFGPMFSQPNMMTSNGTFGDISMYNGVVAPGGVPNVAGNMNVDVNVSTIDALHAVSVGSKKSAMAQAVLQELRRGDGIRKKNARFDIPAERNLNNIDHLISQSTDEQEIKELKQQKRLLRNRQAALDSRQRKKMHTERLEDEKKQFTAIISEMEEDIAMLRKQCERLALEKQQIQDYLQSSFNMEKDSLLREHTMETSRLRKQVAYLTDRVNTLGDEASKLRSSRNSGTNGTTALASGNSLGVFSPVDSNGDTSPSTSSSSSPSSTTTSWNVATVPASASTHSETFGIDPKKIKQEVMSSPQQQHVQQHVPMNQAELSSKGEEAAAEQIAVAGRGQSSLLFMLFLVGAYVISNDPSSAAMSILPPVSEDIRVTTASLLKGLFKEAGVETPFIGASSASAYASGPSVVSSAATAATSPAAMGLADSWIQMLSAGSSDSNANIDMSMLGPLSSMLMVPSFEQERESMFTLSEVQFDNAIRRGPGSPVIGSTASRGHTPGSDALSVVGAGVCTGSPASASASVGADLRNLVGSLGALRSLPNAAEACSRSLLQDLVPVALVRNFANLVTEAHNRCMLACDAVVRASKA